MGDIKRFKHSARVSIQKYNSFHRIKGQIIGSKPLVLRIEQLTIRIIIEYLFVFLWHHRPERLHVFAVELPLVSCEVFKAGDWAIQFPMNIHHGHAENNTHV